MVGWMAAAMAVWTAEHVADNLAHNSAAATAAMKEMIAVA
eukprot:CAMPEP_0170102402 /NCGR_PEP_ID=MMETSP0020_2-20130122/2859_1 /TAXON_ID=98059 /ORGANISM="Dinobryon sp., Strain UTEXLB2267" /LENGTH=39 /DNA_ID= /DNA_START= /DNA_END= /DNA_ORIENTATION=